MPENGEREHPRPDIEHRGERPGKDHEHRQHPQRDGRHVARGATVEQLREQSGVDLKPAGGALGDARRRGFELIDIGQIAADQDVAVLDLAGEQGGAVRRPEQIDRKRAEHRAFTVCGLAKANAALIARQTRLAGHRDRQEKRKSGRLRWPAAHHVIGIGFDPDACLAHVRPRQPAGEGVHKFLLIDLDITAAGVAIGGVGAISEPDRRAHRLERGDQLIIFGLGHVDEDVDADRLGPHMVEIGERAREDRAVERGALAGGELGIGGEGDQQDAPILRDRTRGAREQRPQVIERALGIDRHRQLASVPGFVDPRQLP